MKPAKGKPWYVEILESKFTWYAGCVLILFWACWIFRNWLFGKGGVFDKFDAWLGMEATSYGYDSAVAETAGRLAYDKARSAAMKAHGMDYTQYKAAYYDSWPTVAQYAAGVEFP